LLEEYNQKALLGVSLFCFGSDASVWGLRISLLSFGFLYFISALLLVICPVTLNFSWWNWCCENFVWNCKNKTLLAGPLEE
jgi:hypothetical protein